MLKNRVELTLHGSAPGLFRERRQDVRMMILPTESSRIMLCLPGFSGSLTGYRHKYLNIAERMAGDHGIASVLSSGSDQLSPLYHGRNLLIRVRTTLEFVLKTAPAICGHATPDVLVFAVSAGAGAIAAIAHEYPRITVLVLLAPSAADVPEKEVVKGISRFKGNILVLAGSLDILTGLPGGKLIAQHARQAASLRFFKVLWCDHAFRGNLNYRIFQAAAYDGFLGDGSLLPFGDKLNPMPGKTKRAGGKQQIAGFAVLSAIRTRCVRKSDDPQRIAGGLAERLPKIWPKGRGSRWAYDVGTGHAT